MTGTYTPPACHTPNNVAIRPVPFGSFTATGLPGAISVSDDATAPRAREELVADDDFVANVDGRTVRELVE